MKYYLIELNAIFAWLKDGAIVGKWLIGGAAPLWDIVGKDGINHLWCEKHAELPGDQDEYMEAVDTVQHSFQLFHLVQL